MAARKTTIVQDGADVKVVEGATPTPRRRRVSTKSTVKRPAEIMALVQDKWYADNYVGRKIAGVRDLDVLRNARSKKHNTLIFGPTGPGKTSLVYAYSAEDNLPLLNIPCNGAVTPDDLFGKWIPTEKAGVLRWVDGPLTLIVRYGGIAYFDEINFLPPRIAAVVHGLLDKRRSITLLDKGGEVIQAHGECQIIGTYNPDYEDTRPLNKAFFNRFAFKLPWDYDVAIERELVTSQVLIDLAVSLRQRVLVGDLSTPISTNMLIEMEDFAADETLGPEFAVYNFLSAFDDDERPVVAEAIELVKDRLMDELQGWVYEEVDTDEYEEVEIEVEVDDEEEV